MRVKIQFYNLYLLLSLWNGSGVGEVPFYDGKGEIPFQFELPNSFAVVRHQ